MDKRPKPAHISLYMALFQIWNIYRFPEEFHIDREETMRIAKIGSTTTYHRCLKNLNTWKYIRYFPSHDIYTGSRIRMPVFGTTSETTTDTTDNQRVGQPLTHNINSSKQLKNLNKHKLPKNESEVIIFFKKKNWPEMEARKFYNHYCSIGWKLGGKIKIIDWYSTAENWMIKADEIKKEKKLSVESDQNRKLLSNHLDLKTDKDYGEPL